MIDPQFMVRLTEKGRAMGELVVRLNKEGVPPEEITKQVKELSAKWDTGWRPEESV